MNTLSVKSSTNVQRQAVQFPPKTPSGVRNRVHECLNLGFELTAEMNDDGEWGYELVLEMGDVTIVQQCWTITRAKGKWIRDADGDSIFQTYNVIETWNYRPQVYLPNGKTLRPTWQDLKLAL